MTCVKAEAQTALAIRARRLADLTGINADDGVAWQVGF